MRFHFLHSIPMRGSLMILPLAFHRVEHVRAPQPEHVVELFNLGGLSYCAPAQDPNPELAGTESAEVEYHHTMCRIYNEYRIPTGMILDGHTGALSVFDPTGRRTDGGNILSILFRQQDIQTVLDAAHAGVPVPIRVFGRPALTMSFVLSKVLGIDQLDAMPLAHGDRVLEITVPELCTLLLRLLDGRNRVHHAINAGTLDPSSWVKISDMIEAYTQVYAKCAV